MRPSAQHGLWFCSAFRQLLPPCRWYVYIGCCCCFQIELFFILSYSFTKYLLSNYCILDANDATKNKIEKIMKIIF